MDALRKLDGGRARLVERLCWFCCLASWHPSAPHAEAAERTCEDSQRRCLRCRTSVAAQKDRDAVMIATPDQQHDIVARWGMERGLDVYVQKPLAKTVVEGRHLLAMSKANPKLVT